MGIFNIIIILFYFLIANLTTVILFKNTFGKCMPITMMLSAFSLYISELIFKTFNVGFYLMILYAFISIIILVIKRKNLNVIKKNYFTSTFYIFIISFIILTIFDYNRSFTMWDEYSHWGEMLKERLSTYNSIV